MANLLDAFNRQRVQRAVKQFRRALEAVPLPAEEPALRRRAGAARGEVQGALRAALLGNDAGHQQLLTELSEVRGTGGLRVAHDGRQRRGWQRA